MDRLTDKQIFKKSRLKNLRLKMAHLLWLQASYYCSPFSNTLMLWLSSKMRYDDTDIHNKNAEGSVCLLPLSDVRAQMFTMTSGLTTVAVQAHTSVEFSKISTDTCAYMSESWTQRMTDNPKNRWREHATLATDAYKASDMGSMECQLQSQKEPSEEEFSWHHCST